LAELRRIPLFNVDLISPPEQTQKHDFFFFAEDHGGDQRMFDFPDAKRAAQTNASTLR
jgi:hypothetical protein